MLCIINLKTICTFSGEGSNLSKLCLKDKLSYARVQLPEHIATIYYYFIFDPETFKLSLERNYFWEVCRVVWWGWRTITLRRRLNEIKSTKPLLVMACSELIPATVKGGSSSGALGARTVWKYVIFWLYNTHIIWF